MGLLAGHTEHPIGWGPQPDDDWNMSWTDLLYCEGDLRIPERIERGSRIVTASGSQPGPDGRADPHPGGNASARYLCVCWCGKTVQDADPADVLNGRTHTCGHQRCKDPRGVVMGLCSDRGPRCPECGVKAVYCLLPAGHAGDHKHASTPSAQVRRVCKPITWPAVVVAVDVPACPRRLPPSAAGLRGVRLSVDSDQGDRPVMAPACLAGPVAHHV